MELTRIRLAILSILVVLIKYCSGENEGMETEINWERCRKTANEPRAETKCYVIQKCRMHASTALYFEKLIDPNDFPKTNGKGVCDTGIQFKPYSKMKWLVYMQVKKEPTDQALVPADGVWIEANGEKYFGCKKAANAEYFGSAKIGAVNFPNGKDEFSGDRIFCSFIISGITDTLEAILTESATAEFKFKKDVEQIYDMQSSLRSITSEVEGSITCDPDKAKFDSNYKNDELITYKTQITKPSKNQCLESTGKLFVKLKSQEQFVEVTDIVCKKDPGGYSFAYTPKIPPTTEVKITANEDFHVFCGTKVCAQCSPLDPPSGSTAVAFPPLPNPNAETCPTIECKDNKWAYKNMNDKTGLLVATLSCKKKGANEKAWFMAKKGEKEGFEVKQAGCTTKIDCYSENPLKFSCPEKTCTLANETTAPPTFGCSGVVMYKTGSENPVETDGITCDDNLGKWMSTAKTEVKGGSYVYCKTDPSSEQKGGKNPASASLLGGVLGGALGLVVLLVIVFFSAAAIRRYRKYTPSERQQRIRPRWKWYHKIYPAKLVTDDLAILKEWDDNIFNTIIEQWLKFSIYERYKFAERVGFELGVGSNCEYFFTLFSKVFEIETDYRVWQNLVPVFKLLHAQAVDKENNLDCDKRMRKWCIGKCKKILEKVGWEGCNNEFRETAYQRYIIFNLLYYCEDKDFSEKLLEFFDKGQFHGLHSINRQIAWAAAVRDKDQFEVAVKVADEAVCDKNAKRQVAEKRAKMNGGKKASASEKTDNGKTDWSIKSSKSSKGGGPSSKDKKGTSKESKSSASSQGGSKSNKSNRSNKSNKSNKDKKDKSGKDKKGSKETPSGKAKKGDSKEASKSSKRDKKDKGGSKEAKKGSREKGGADEKVESGKEKKEKEPASDKPPSDKDKKTKSGKDKKTTSGKDKKDSSKEKRTTSGKEKKDKSTKSSKEKKDKSGKDKKSSKEKKSEKTCESSKSGKSSKDKKNDSKKSTKEKTAIDKSSKSKKSTMSKKKKKPTKIGYKERKDADGDKLHGDRAQHVFFAIGSSRNKEQIAAFLDYYVEHKEYDPSNLVYLFAATLEWDDTRSYGLDLFLNMNKKAFVKMPPGNKYHMRILKNFRKYVIGELDLQKLQSHIVKDPNYNVKHFAQLELSLMLKRIHNNVTYQEKMIEDLDSALKKMNF